MEAIMVEMQDPKSGLKGTEQKLNVTTIPCVITEAQACGTMLVAYGFVYPLQNHRKLVMCNDASLYRFQRRTHSAVDYGVDRLIDPNADEDTFFRYLKSPVYKETQKKALNLEPHNFSEAQLEQNARSRGLGVHPIILWQQEEEERAKAAIGFSSCGRQAMMSKIDRQK
ncbi:hypothetical protein CRUP_006477 [Coryphaenoides rupestris]|nr:hypothetical protein CRUP_006477 [Coryphaenoides rupestris]